MYELLYKNQNEGRLMNDEGDSEKSDSELWFRTKQVISVTWRFSTPSLSSRRKFFDRKVSSRDWSDDPPCSAIRKERLAPFNPLRFMGLSWNTERHNWSGSKWKDLRSTNQSNTSSSEGNINMRESFSIHCSWINKISFREVSKGFGKD